MQLFIQIKGKDGEISHTQIFPSLKNLEMLHSPVFCEIERNNNLTCPEPRKIEFCPLLSNHWV